MFVPTAVLGNCFLCSIWNYPIDLFWWSSLSGSSSKLYGNLTLQGLNRIGKSFCRTKITISSNIFDYKSPLYFLQAVHQIDLRFLRGLNPGCLDGVKYSQSLQQPQDLEFFSHLNWRKSQTNKIKEKDLTFCKRSHKHILVFWTIIIQDFCYLTGNGWSLFQCSMANEFFWWNQLTTNISFIWW